MQRISLTVRRYKCYQFVPVNYELGQSEQFILNECTELLQILIFSCFYMRRASNSASEIIRIFTQQSHEIELQTEKKRFLDIQEGIKKKRKKLLEKAGIETQQTSLASKIQGAQKFKTMDDHRITLQQFAQTYDTDLVKGLSQQQAQRRLLAEGENRLTEKKGTHWSIQLLKQMSNPLALLLWAGAILSFVAYGLPPYDSSNLYLGIVLIIVILFVGMLTFYENWKSQAIMSSFKDFIPPYTTVIRDGEQKSIEAAKLVRGDVIKIDLGKKIPADIRIINSQGMKVDNSSLTGQTELLLRTVQCSNPDNVLQTKNVAWFSTMCRQGNGRGVVMLTGDNTFIGQIAHLAATADQEDSPLTKQIQRFIARIGIFSVVSGLVIFIVGFIIGFPPITNFIYAIGIIVGNVPNGLLAEVTVALTLTAKKLSTRQVLCKTLEAVETLGSTSCICSDKTGTLTQNKMTACHLWYGGHTFQAANFEKLGKQYKFEYDINDQGFKELQQTAAVCSVANFDPSLPGDKKNKINNDEKISPEDKTRLLKQLQEKWDAEYQHMPYLERPTTGDASESALIKFFQPIEDIVFIRNQHPVAVSDENQQCKIPFNSTNKYAYSINKSNRAHSDWTIYTKGAPERIWEMCTHIMVGGVPVLKNEEWDRKFKAANLAFGKQGQRVLGFAKLQLPKQQFPQNFRFNIVKPNFPFKEQVFVGCVSLADPPRDTVPYAVLKCQAAGVKVIMVTGDQPVTAAAIARQCHIITQKKTVNQICEQDGLSFEEAFSKSNAIVIHGDQLTKMALEDEGLPESEQGKKLEKWLQKSQIVFARTSPAQKLVIVQAVQKLGYIVAVTGDGVNDSPAIKKADIGIAMGIAGTDVAKDAADMVLLNDDFSSIVTGIEQGRRIFDNLKKAIAYAMTSQIPEIAPFIGLIIFNFPVPVSTVILLYINIGTDLVPAISFAYEQAELDLMTRKPRPREEHLVTMKLMCQSYGTYGFAQFWGCMFTFFIVMNDFGFPPSQLLNSGSIYIYKHNQSDQYNPTDPYFGNSLLSSTNCNSGLSQIDWLYLQNYNWDLRMSILNCNVVVNGSTVYTQAFQWGPCRVQQISPMSNKPICYTTEASKYGQSAYFYAVVLCQYMNVFICKTRKNSLFDQGINNKMTFFGIITEIMLTLVVAFFQPFNIAFGTRDNIFIHFGLTAVPIAIFILIVDEIRKYLIRNLPREANGKPNLIERTTMW